MSAPDDMDRGPARKRRGFWRSLITFLNTGLGLWFLSSVVLSLLTFGFQQHSANLQQRDRNRRLQFEITMRLETCARFIVESPILPRSPKNPAVDEVLQLWSRDDSGVPADNMCPIFEKPKAKQILNAEFAERSVVSLLAEYALRSFGTLSGQ
jgi:hypothetical protein